jgi:Flp pilus assembly protein TadD
VTARDAPPLEEQTKDGRERFESDLEAALVRDEKEHSKRWNWSWVTEVLLKNVTSTVFSLSAAALAILIVSLFIWALWGQTISIQPLSVPKLVAENGFTPDVIASKLRDVINTMLSQARSPKKYREITQQNELPDIVVPSVGISVQALAAKVHTFLGITRRQNITGELATQGGLLFLSLRLNEKIFFTNQKGVDLNRLDDLMADAGRAVLDVTQPSALGRVLYQLGRRDEAMAEYEKASELDPKDAAPHNGLGNVLADLGRRDEAMAEYKKASELDPKDEAPHYNLGRVLIQLGRRDEAMPEFKKASDLIKKASERDPKDASLHYYVGDVLAQLERRDEAMAEFKKASKLDPKDAAPHTGLGSVLADLGRRDEAMAEFKKASELDPKVADPHTL